MITEQDLQEAIAECQGQRNPNASTCIKLAAFLIIQKEMYGKEKPQPQAQIIPEYSYAAPPDDGYVSDTEFGEAIDGMKQADIMPIMDELMSTLQVVQPRIYASVMRKIKERD